MKLHLLLILPLVVVSQAFALLNTNELIKAGTAISPFIYNNADLVYVDSYCQVEYQTNGSYTVISDGCVKIMTEVGKRSMMTSGLGYDLAYGTSMFIRVEIIKPDGRIIPIDIAENSKTQIDSSQMGSNIYDPNSKEVSLTIPGVEIGDMVREMSKSTTTKARMPDTYSDSTLLEYTSPIIKDTIEYIAPASLPLVNKVIRAEIPKAVTMTETKKDGKIIYKWTAQNIPQVFPEPSMPSLSTVGQRLLVSTIPDWKTVSKWYYELCQKPLSATNAAMVKKVVELTKDCQTDQEKIKAIFHFVSQKVRYMGITTEDVAPGYEPHPVSNTFDNLYGVCRDKAALLAAMQEIAGFKAYPVLIKVGPKLDEDVPSPYFNHAITAVELEPGEYILMDSTDENTKDLLPSYLSDCSYLVAKKEGDILRTTAIVPAEENMLLVDSNIVVGEDDRLEGEVVINFEGINDNNFRSGLKSMKEDQRKKVFEGYIKSSINGGELLEYEILPKDMDDTSTNISIRLKFAAEDFPIGNDDLMTLPSVSIGSDFAAVLSVIGATGLDKRKYPYITGTACGIKAKYSYRLDGAESAISLPTLDKVDNEFIYLNDECTFTNNIYSGVEEFKVLVEELSTNQYLVLKDILKELEYSSRKKTFFKRRPKKIAKKTVEVPATIESPKFDPILANIKEDPYADSNVLTILNESKTELIDQTSYKYETHVKKKVLTYAGKKRSSELSFTCNPSYEEFELLEAKVISPDGQVNKVKKEEINIMDSSWVSSAPRYPGSKRMVVSLPKVEVGSIIEYKYRGKMKKQQFYSTSQSFRFTEPCELRKKTIVVPPHLKLKLRPFQGGYVAPKHSVVAGTNIYTWTEVCTNVIKPESGSPPSSYYLKGAYGTTGNWKDFSKLVRKNLERTITNQTKCIAKALEVTSACSNDTERIIAIRDYIEKNISVAGPNFLSLPLSCLSNGDTVLEDAYGNLADFTVVYYCMLEAIGLKPEFLLTSGVAKVNGLERNNIKCPQEGFFDSMMIRVKNNGEWIYLNDTTQYAQLGTTSVNREFALDLTPKSCWNKLKFWESSIGDIYTISIPEKYRGKTRNETYMIFDDQGTVLLTTTNWIYGTSFSSIHSTFEEMTPEERRRFEMETVSSISKTAKALRDVVVNYDQYPGFITMQVEIDEYAVVDGDSFYFDISNASGNTLGLKLNERKYPLLLGGYIDSESSTTITLPKSFTKVIMAPKKIKWKAPKNSGTLIKTADIEDGNLEIDTSLHLEPVIVPASMYPELLESNKKLSHPGQNLILLHR